MTLEDLEKKYILETLKSTNWNQKKTAGILAIGRNTLWRKIKAYNIQLPESAKLPA
jgi:transcriptional regulator of acetoin/glycerol metabolism